jgi:Na+-translocating ferredoxin:NAD+ oxidoreductase RnfD subunit
MTYIEKKIIKGKPYYYLKKSERVGGRVKTETVAYFGKNLNAAKAAEAVADFGSVNLRVIPNFFSDFYNVMIISQIIISAYAVYKIGLSFFWSAVVAIVVAVAVDLAIKYLKKEVTFPKSAIISGFIIANVLAANQLYLFAVFAAAAMILKHVIILDNKHIFNPANLALATLVFFLPSSHGWSGGLLIPLVIVLGLWTIFTLKRLHLPAVFFGTTLVLLLAFNGLAGLEKFISDGAMWFFGWFMLTEPITSPITTKGQVLFGFLAAVFAFAIMSGLPQFAFPLALVAVDVLVPVIDRYLKS